MKKKERDCAFTLIDIKETKRKLNNRVQLRVIWSLKEEEAEKIK